MPIETKVYMCRHCTRKRYHHRQSRDRHEKRCYANPANRMCAICAHLILMETDEGELEVCDHVKSYKIWPYEKDCKFFEETKYRLDVGIPSHFPEKLEMFNYGWKCEFCYKIYKTRASARQHEKECHKNPATMSCASCHSFMWYRHGIDRPTILPDVKNKETLLSRAQENYLYAVCLRSSGREEGMTHRLVKKNCWMHCWPPEKINSFSWEEIKELRAGR